MQNYTATAFLHIKRDAHKQQLWVALFCGWSLLFKEQLHLARSFCFSGHVAKGYFYFSKVILKNCVSILKILKKLFMFNILEIFGLFSLQTMMINAL